MAVAVAWKSTSISVVLFLIVNCATMGKLWANVRNALASLGLQHIEGSEPQSNCRLLAHRNTHGKRTIRTTTRSKAQIKYTYDFDDDIMILQGYFALSMFFPALSHKIIALENEY